MKKLLQYLTSFISLAFLAMFLNVSSAMAGRSCHNVYGGGEVCEQKDIQIDKVVLRPDTNQFLDNIDSGSFNFNPSQDVTFELRIKNTGDIRLDKVNVKDTLPDTLRWKSGGNGSSSSQDVTFEINSLDPGKTENRIIVATFLGANNLPVGITCSTNRGEAKIADNGDVDSDNASFCVKNGERTVAITTMPSTGPEMPIVLLLELIGFTSLGMGYVYVVRSANK